MFIPSSQSNGVLCRETGFSVNELWDVDLAYSLIHIPRKNQVISASFDRNAHLCALPEKNPDHSPSTVLLCLPAHSSPKSLKWFLNYFIYVYVFVPTRVYIHYMPACSCRGQRARETLKVELQVTVSILMWVLGLNTGPLEEQNILLTTKLSLQSLVKFLLDFFSRHWI